MYEAMTYTQQIAAIVPFDHIHIYVQIYLYKLFYKIVNNFLEHRNV